MKMIRHISLIALLPIYFAYGQGTFLYDQQSSTDETLIAGGGIIQDLAPYGQTFTPNFSTINFIRLSLYDWNPNNGTGASLYLNLLSSDLRGPVLATTSVVSLEDGFSNFANFYLPGNVSIIPGNTYAFEIVAEPGSDLWAASAAEYGYVGGMVYANGSPSPGSDLWFREGTYAVPEPSPLILFFGSAIGFLSVRNVKTWQRHRPQ